MSVKTLISIQVHKMFSKKIHYAHLMAKDTYLIIKF